MEEHDAVAREAVASPALATREITDCSPPRALVSRARACRLRQTRNAGVLRAGVPRSVRRSRADECGRRAVEPENPESRLKPIPSWQGTRGKRERVPEKSPALQTVRVRLCFFARAPHDCTRARRTTDAPEESGPAAMAQQAIYEQMVFPTRFVWAHGGKQVRPARIATFVGFSATRV